MPFASSRADLRALGSAWAFMAAIAIIVVWGVTGHIFHYSDTWQLIINTGTTIVTFLMVFLIQNTQNRDSKAIQLKLDELIRSLHRRAQSRWWIWKLSLMTDLEEFQKEFERLRNRSEASRRGDGRTPRKDRVRLKPRASPRRMNLGPAGQSWNTSQCAQSGLRAKQRRRPCQMSQWLQLVQCLLRDQLHQVALDFLRILVIR